MTANHHLEVVVAGAGLIGLTTAILLARDGHRVTVVDRDPAPPPADGEDAWEAWERPGVNQFRLPHLMLPRWTREVERELPELIDALGADGVQRVNLLHLQPDAVTHGWQPGDERFDTVTARRPVLEASLGRLADAEPGVTVRRGVRVHGLLTGSDGGGVPHVRGLRTTAGDLVADLVVDAAGRRTPLPGWLDRLGGPAPVEQRDASGFVYYSRYFLAPDGKLPAGPGSVLTHHPSWSVLTLPSDHSTYCVALVISARDKTLRRLRDPRVWQAAALTSPVSAPWVSHGAPTTDVLAIAGIEDVHRSYLRDGAPVVTGLVGVGDSTAATNPSLGRGASIGMIHACALRDALARSARDPRDQVEAFAAETARQVAPWVDATTWFDRHRLGEIEADVAGTPYLPDDMAWPMATSLQAGADHDPVLARASSMLGGLLAAPPEVFADADVQRRLLPYRDAPRYAADGPTRDALLRAVEGADDLMSR